MTQFLSAPRLGTLACAAVSAAALAACNDTPTEAKSAPAPVAIEAVAMKAALPIDGTAVNDITARLLPSLGDVVLAARLRGQLDDLSAQLAKGESAAALKSIDRAQKLLAAYAAHPTGAFSAADVDAIGLALKATAESLAQPAAQ